MKDYKYRERRSDMKEGYIVKILDHRGIPKQLGLWNKVIEYDNFDIGTNVIFSLEEDDFITNTITKKEETDTSIEIHTGEMVYYISKIKEGE
jgi:hypothetical protein